MLLAGHDKKNLTQVQIYFIHNTTINTCHHWHSTHVFDKAATKVLIAFKQLEYLFFSTHMFALLDL